MFRDSTHPGQAPRKSRAALLVLAAALAGGMAIGSPAFARDQQPAAQKQAQGNSKAFADAYTPMMKIITDPAGDYASAKSMIPAVQASIQNNVDKNTFGSALINLGTKLSDRSLQRQGLELMLQSGQVAPDKVGQFQFLLGNLAYDAKDYDAARTALQAAVAAGYTQDDPRPLIAESYFAQGQQEQGLQYLSGMIKQTKAAGGQVPDAWLLRGLKVAYQAKLVPQANEYAEDLVAGAPTAQNWQAALQVINAVDPLDAEGELDVFRLMQQTGALKDKHDYYAYVSVADPRKFSSEVLAALDQGVKAGVLSASDPEYQKAKSVADAREAENKSAAALIEEDARKSPTGKIALASGDQYLSLGQYEKAAEMYQMALTKGVDDRSLPQLRLGIAEAKAGHSDQAKAALQQVTGARAPVARMWLAYVNSKHAA